MLHFHWTADNMIKFAMYSGYAVILLQLCLSLASELKSQQTANSTLLQHSNKTIPNEPIGCTCGVFLSGQFTKGSKEQPKGTPALLYDQPETFPCTPVGNRLCVNKCLETIVKFLPNSPAVLCASLDRDCYKERVYLFIKNCKNEWINTNLSAGREYCCKNGTFYKCPLN